MATSVKEGLLIKPRANVGWRTDLWITECQDRLVLRFLVTERAAKERKLASKPYTGGWRVDGSDQSGLRGQCR